MKGIEQGLILIALIVGFVLALNIGQARIDQEKARLDQEIVRLESEHPSWSSQLCYAVAAGRIPEERVQQHPDWPWNLIAEREIELGMTTEMVRESWGSPTEHEKSVYSWGTEEEWIYRSIADSEVIGRLIVVQEKAVFLHFKDGILTNWSSKTFPKQYL